MECARRAYEAMRGVDDVEVRQDLWRLAIRYSQRDRIAGAGGLEIADARLTASFYRGAQGER
jgi:hypothetical protein